LENNKRRNKTKKLNVAVIGSGATALGVIKTLLEKKKFNITVISKSINEQNKIFKKKRLTTSNHEIRSNFDKPLIKIDIDRNYSYVSHNSSGGLSDYWSGSLALPEKKELKKWGLDKISFNKYFKFLSKIIPISGVKNTKNYFLPNSYINEDEIQISSLLSNFLNIFKNNKNFQISKNFVSVSLSQKSKSQNCINCSDCFSGCVQDSIFRPSREIFKLIKYGHINYINNNVEKLSVKNKNSVEFKNGKLSFDKIYMCAGAISTAKIILNSFGFPKKNLFIYDIPSHTYACFNFLNNKKYKSNFFGFSNLALKLNLKTAKNYILCGNLPMNIFKKYLKFNLLSILLKKILRNRIFYFQIFGDQNNFHKLYFDKNLKLKLSKFSNFDSKAIIKNLNYIFKKKGFYIPSFLKMDNSSAHYSSNLFKAYNIKKNINGKFKKNLYVCDSSVLNAPSSSTSHTFFLIANACRIAELSIKD